MTTPWYTYDMINSFIFVRCPIIPLLLNKYIEGSPRRGISENGKIGY